MLILAMSGLTHSTPVNTIQSHLWQIKGNKGLRLVMQVRSQSPCSSDRLMKRTLLLPSLLLRVKQALQHRRKAGEPSDCVDSRTILLIRILYCGSAVLVCMPNHCTAAHSKPLVGNSSDNNSFDKPCPVARNLTLCFFATICG